MLTFLYYILLINVVHFPNVILVGESEQECTEECKAPIYCNEEILRTVQLSEFIKNPQGFVDEQLKYLPGIILENFKKVQNEKDVVKKNQRLQEFIADNFEPESSLFGSCEWNSFPKISEINVYILDENYRRFYHNINEEWKKFAVRVPEEYEDEYESLHHSLLYVPNCYIKKDESNNMPSLFQSYWIVRGMLTNRMFDKVEEMLKNYAYLIKKYNFVPYTNRVYALDRPQYPLLALMVEHYFENHANQEFLQEMLPAMAKEFDWWWSNRRTTITIGSRFFNLFHYFQPSCSPRPELYKHDYNLAENFDEDLAKKRFYSAVRGLNECGFGFSSRFMKYTNYLNPLLNVKVSNIIPVELNSVLQRYAFLLGQWYTDVDKNKAKDYTTRSKIIKIAMKSVLWSPKKNMWLDYDIDNDILIEDFSPTHLMPLFTVSHYADEKIGDKALQYLLDEDMIKADNYPRHLLVPTSKYQTKMLWDYPFGSPFLTAFVIEGLRKTGNKRAMEVATNMAHSLIKVMYDGYEKHGNLLERYIVLPNNIEAKKYNEDNAGKISAASLGCVITMLRWYGEVTHSDDYQSILSSDFFSPQELVYASQPTSLDMNLDKEMDKIFQPETEKADELIDDASELNRPEKMQKTSGN